MNTLRKLIALLLLTVFSTSAFAAITNADLFSWAAATYPSYFPGTPTAGQYQKYDYRSYPANGNYLAVDNTGTVYVLGPISGNVILNVGTLTAFAPAVTAWQATQVPTCTSPQVLTNGVCVTPTAPSGRYVSQGGLTWMPINSSLTLTWDNANSFCANTTIYGQTGWRLPTQPELSALHAAFQNNLSALTSQQWMLGNTWSSTGNGSSRYGVNLYSGYVFSSSTTGYTNYVTCVTNASLAPNFASLQTITMWGDSTTTVGVGSTTTVTATATSALPVNLSSLTPSICTVSGYSTVYVTFVAAVAAGTCTISGDQAGNSTYSAARAMQNITVITPSYVSQGGLTWMPVSLTTYTYAQATALCAGTINGQTGWRLPTLAELTGLTTLPQGYGTATGGLYGSGAMNGQGWTLALTWSSTPFGSGNHYNVTLASGNAGSDIDSSGIYVTCVR